MGREQKGPKKTGKGPKKWILGGKTGRGGIVKGEKMKKEGDLLRVFERKNKKQSRGGDEGGGGWGVFGQKKPF